jgi:hypothetical protein
MALALSRTMLIHPCCTLSGCDSELSRLGLTSPNLAFIPSYAWAVITLFVFVDERI